MLKFDDDDEAEAAEIKGVLEADSGMLVEAKRFLREKSIEDWDALC